MLISRRALMIGGASLAGAAVLQPAHASVALPLTLKQLVGASRQVVVADALEGYSVWEKFGKRKRIVTYTRVGVRELVNGARIESEVLVRTLGGRVGDVGEIVHGEAVLLVGSPALLFLHEHRDGTLNVAAMGQGHYPVAQDERGVARLRRSPRLAELVRGSDQSAVEMLVGRTLPDAKRLIVEAARP